MDVLNGKEAGGTASEAAIAKINEMFHVISVNIVFTKLTKILSPYPPTLFRQTRQRTFATFG